MIEASVFGAFGGFFWTLKAILLSWATVLGLSVGALVTIALVILVAGIGFRLAIVIGVAMAVVVVGSYGAGVTKCKVYADNVVTIRNLQAKLKAKEAELASAKEVETFEGEQFPQLEAERARLAEQVQELDAAVAERDAELAAMERAMGAEAPDKVKVIRQPCHPAATKKEMEAIRRIGQ